MLWMRDKREIGISLVTRSFDFYESDATARRFRFDLNNGRLGIGTNNTPSEALDVTGDIEFSGALQRASGTFKCPDGLVLMGFDDGTDASEPGQNHSSPGLVCDLPPQIYQ